MHMDFFWFLANTWGLHSILEGGKLSGRFQFFQKGDPELKDSWGQGYLSRFHQVSPYSFSLQLMGRGDAVMETASKDKTRLWVRLSILFPLLMALSSYSIFCLP